MPFGVVTSTVAEDFIDVGSVSWPAGAGAAQSPAYGFEVSIQFTNSKKAQDMKQIQVFAPGTGLTTQTTVRAGREHAKMYVQ